MARAGKSLLRVSGLRAAADDLGREQKLCAAAAQRATLAGALPENPLTRRCNQAVRLCFTGSSRSLVSLMSALPPKADMCGATRDVRFGPKADIGTLIR